VAFGMFGTAARLAIVFAQEEARELGHAEIGADHLLLGVLRSDAALLDVDEVRLRDEVSRGRERRRAPDAGGVLPYSPDALAAIEGAPKHAAVRDDAEVRPADIWLSVLDGGGLAARALQAAGVQLQAVRDAALAAVNRPETGHVPESAPRIGVSEGDYLSSLAAAERALAEGDAVMVTLNRDLPLGDIGNFRVDARLLLLMLAADGPAARLLRAHGIHGSVIQAALGTP
jgi:ATP-dependent Clp protease ATP-binding subunit ClpC